MQANDSKAEQMEHLHQRIIELRQQLNALQKNTDTAPIADYQFDTLDGKTTLSNLFGDKCELFLIHNMGSSCPYCTLWADGFNGVAAHLKNRAAVAISSPDTPAQQEEFRAARAWDFSMVSLGDSTFASDMGYQSGNSYSPGVSIFRRDDNEIRRISTSPFGPGDDYCAVWHLLDLLPDGANGWQPKFSYD